MTPTKCACCDGEHPEFTCTPGPFWPTDLVGSRYCKVCCEGLDDNVLITRIRERRAEGGKAKGYNVADFTLHIGGAQMKSTPLADFGLNLDAFLGVRAPADATPWLPTLATVPEPTLDLVPPTCRTCSAVATDYEYCVYCVNRFRRSTRNEAELRQLTDNDPDAIAARSRNLAALEGEKPRSTRTSREMAKGHPSTWPSNEGED